MKKMRIYVFGPKNPCRNCITTENNVRTAVKGLEDLEIEFDVVHQDIASRENIEAFGLLRSPAVVIGDYVLCQGEVLSAEKIARKIEDFVKLL